jgi:protein-S-isoprenylcysteine O-methyltransferase Ste14
MASRQSWASVPPEQLPFVMAGKWYLIARLLYQLVVIAWCLRAWSAGEATWGIANVAGTALLAAGYALRRWARAVLGERFRSFEVRREERGIETGGPYAWMRHPGYTGLAVMDFALPLALGVPALMPLSLVLLWLVVRRARLEAALMRQVYS